MTAWAVPAWVGNDSYFSDENIAYHVRWLQCARDEHPAIGNVDFVGVWNERSWGDPDWVKRFRADSPGRPAEYEPPFNRNMCRTKTKESKTASNRKCH